MVTHWLAFFGKEILKKSYLKRLGRKYQHGNVFTRTRSSDCSYRYYVDDIFKMVGQKQNKDRHSRSNALDMHGLRCKG